MQMFGFVWENVLKFFLAFGHEKSINSLSECLIRLKICQMIKKSILKNSWQADFEKIFLFIFHRYSC
jgi:hypothetical protein